MSLNERFDALMRQHEFLLAKSLVPPNRPKPDPINPRRCFKCQGLGYTPSDCPNKEITSLAEWEKTMEEENEEENEDESDHELEEIQAEVVEKASEEELLMLRRVPSHQKGVKDKPANPLSTHPAAQTLIQNFCHLIYEEITTECEEPFLKALNSELRAFEEVVQSKCKESPTNTFRTSKGSKRKRVSKIKRDLFARLILFQQKLNQEWKVIT